MFHTHGNNPFNIGRDCVGVQWLFSPTVAVVGLENSVYSVTEDDGVVEVCAVVQSANMESPNMECPIDFAFTVILLTSDDSAGIRKLVTCCA